MLGGNGVWCLCFDSFRPRVVAMHSTDPHSGFGFPFLCISSPFRAPPTLRTVHLSEISLLSLLLLLTVLFHNLVGLECGKLDVLAIARGPTEEIYDLFAGQNCDA